MHFVLNNCIAVCVSVVLAASAKQLMDTPTEHEEAKLQRQWALFDPTTVFTVRKNSDPKWDEYPELTLEGSVGYPVRRAPYSQSSFLAGFNPITMIIQWH